MVEAYPLHWPDIYPRAKQRKKSRFVTTPAKARDEVYAEIKRIQGKNAVISTNVPTNSNGELRADYARYRLDDPGVAVYFTYEGEQVCMCADGYEKVWDNLKAVSRTLAALRQISRDSVSEFLKRTFQGFPAISQTSTAIDIWSIFDIAPTKDKSIIEQRFKELSRTMHPDNGGDTNHWMTILEARKQVLQYANS